jgi:hypothetical protein
MRAAVYEVKGFPATWDCVCVCVGGAASGAGCWAGARGLYVEEPVR